MENVCIYSIPPCRMVSSGRGMFGDGILEAFDEWFSKYPREMFPKDFLWFDGQGFVWYYVYQDGMDVPSQFEIVDFPGGMYAVAAGKDNDGEAYKDAMNAVDAFIAANGFEKDPERVQLGNIITQLEAAEVLGYEQMNYYVPIRVR